LILHLYPSSFKCDDNLQLFLHFPSVDWKKQFSDVGSDLIKEVSSEVLDKTFDFAVDELLKQLNVDIVR